MLFFKKKFFPIKTTIFVHKENSYYTMNHTVEDLSLFNALRQGDGNSFDHLFRRYYPMLCAYAHRLVSLEDAEEIVQEVMLWLWENRGDLIIESSLNQYLFKMTYRRVLNHLTREQVKTKAEAAFYERTQAALCEVDYGRFEELDRKIKEAMAALPDSYREAFVMHRFKELSYKAASMPAGCVTTDGGLPHPAGIEAASCFLKGLLAHAGMAGGLKSTSS